MAAEPIAAPDTKDRRKSATDEKAQVIRAWLFNNELKKLVTVAAATANAVAAVVASDCGGCVNGSSISKPQWQLN